jgi:hypothetical protein
MGGAPETFVEGSTAAVIPPADSITVVIVLEE